MFLECLRSVEFVPGGAADVGKKKILLLKGKEREIPNVSFTLVGGGDGGGGCTLKMKLAPLCLRLGELHFLS